MAERPDKQPTDAEAVTESAPLLDVTPAGARSTSAEDAPTLFAGRYEVLGLLGSGGMGTVYRALDRELEETVALKLLRKELAAAPGMLERFRREVKLARRVTHKNVARTFDIGEHDGDRFLTMELIDGEMLGAHLARKGRLSLTEVVPIALDVCAGLTAAHAAGVLHRDLKPENVILARDDRAVITDFGIARAASEGELGRTGGGIVGTPAYMAPEQVEGSRDLDARTDLYALGAMLFELLSGKMAWTGDSAFSIAAARVLRPPPDVRVHVPKLPVAAAELLQKLMARKPADRFASAEEVATALAALTADAGFVQAPTVLTLTPPARSEPRRSRKTVAVLPIVNLGAGDDAYLAQTVTEDLVDLLSIVPELRVRPRGETARFDNTTRDVREIGRSLGVDVVVDASLRRLGEIVRIAVRVVTVEDGFQLWARRFDRAPAEVLAVAEEAASAVARALAAERNEHARPVVEDAVAQELYLRGRYLLRRGWFEISRDGVAMLREAHTRAPNDTRIAGMYALALARILAADPNPDVASHHARVIAEQTLAQDPRQPESLVALGMVHISATSYGAAAQTLLHALDGAPNSVEALDVLGRLLAEADGRDRGIAMLRSALAIDPDLVFPRHAIARTLALRGDYEGATEVLGPLPSEQRELTPRALLLARFALWRRSPEMTDRLVSELESRAMTPFGQTSILGLLRVVRTGRLAPDDKAGFEKALPLHDGHAPRRVAFNAQLRAEVKLAVGDIEGALADLRVADAHGLIDVAWLDHVPLLDGLRDREDFIAIRERAAARAREVSDIVDAALGASQLRRSS